MITIKFEKPIQKEYFYCDDCPPKQRGEGCYGDCTDCFSINKDKYERILKFQKAEETVESPHGVLSEEESYIYKGEDGYLYTYEEKTGRIWSLSSGNYHGEPGKPMPVVVKGIGKMTLLGVFKLDY